MIDSQLDLERTIQADFNDGIAKPRRVQVAWPNVPFEPPLDEAWVQFSLQPADPEQVAIGDGATHRYRGVLFANVYAPIGLGQALALEIADAILGRYRAASRGGVIFRTPHAANGRREAGWWKVPVQCPFFADLNVEGE